MTSNFIGQWQNVAGVWTEKTRYSYVELGTTNKNVEGMGYGALGHFWAGSGVYIYELGGGSIQQVINPVVPEPSTMMLLGSLLTGLVGFRGKKLFKKE